MKWLFLLGIVALVIALVIYLSSRDYAEITDFVHLDTVDVPEKTDPLASDLSDYRLDGALFVPRIPHMDYESSRIDLLVYTYGESETPLTVQSARLRSGAGDELADMNEAKTFALKPDRSREGLFKGGVVLMGPLEDKILLDASEEGSLVLEVSVSAGEAQKDITYSMEKRVRKYVVQR